MSESGGQNEGRAGFLSRFLKRQPEQPIPQTSQENPGLVKTLNRIADERNALIAQRTGSAPSDRSPADSGKIQALEAEAEKLGYMFGPDNKLIKMPEASATPQADTVTQLVNAMASAREQRAAAGVAEPTNPATQALNREPASPPAPPTSEEKQAA